MTPRRRLWRGRARVAAGQPDVERLDAEDTDAQQAETEEPEAFARGAGPAEAEPDELDVDEAGAGAGDEQVQGERVEDEDAVPPAAPDAHRGDDQVVDGEVADDVGTGAEENPAEREVVEPDTAGDLGAEAEERPVEGEVVEPGGVDNLGAGQPDGEAHDRGEPGPAKSPRGAWGRLLRAGSPRATRANVLALVLAGALGFAIIAQVRQTSIQGLENLREDELVRIFAGVDQDGDRLADDIRGLESSLQLLQSQSTNDAEAQRAAQQRLDALGILAGTAKAQGPGIVLTIRDPDLAVTSPVILDAIQELRDAGAEAIQIGDERVVADTWFSQTDEGISVSGTELRPPYVIRAIGDGDTLAGAMEIPGGVSATVRRAGGETDVQIRDEVVVDALLSLTPPQYAQPVPTSTP